MSTAMPLTTPHPYPAYKPSAVLWIGDLPEHWEVWRGKAILRPVDVRSETGDDELLTVSAQRGVVPRKSANVTMFKAESYVGYKLCWPGDLVINSLWAWAHGLGVSLHHGIVSSAYGVYRPLPRANARFIHLLVRSVPFQWELQVRSKGIWVSRLQLTDESFLEAPFPLPPLPEQAAIVRYLDHADRRIRRYVAAKRKLIALLEEEKQAIVNRAVTRGLDPNVRLKPSGVEWLGDVPEHWEIVQLGRIGAFSKGSGGTKEDEVPSGVPCVRYGDLYTTHKYFVSQTRSHVSPEKANAYTPIIRGDVLFPTSGETIEEIGKSAVNLLNTQVLCGGDTIIFRPTIPMEPKFAGYALDCPAAQTQKSLMGRGITIMHIYSGQLKYLWLPLPPLSEQTAVVEYLDEATSSIAATIARARRQIELVQEYRTRLIADAVTGKMDVREAASQLPDETDDQDPIEESSPLADGMDEALYDIDESSEELAIESEVSA